jgi:hypothetical protein
MYELLLVLIAIMFLAVKTKEHFGLVVGGKDIVTTDSTVNDGVEVFSIFPNSCPGDRLDKDAGLCYVPCRSGFKGVGPVCWAESRNVGVGKPVGLEPCPPGWNNDGLICREPLRWNPCAWRGLFKECWGGLEGGKLRGRLNNGGICDYPQDRSKLPGWLRDGKHPEKIAGLCYKKCPAEYPQRIPGMPYLCYKGGPLSYGRGVGTVPCIVRLGRKWCPLNLV